MAARGRRMQRLVDLLKSRERKAAENYARLQHEVQRRQQLLDQLSAHQQAQLQAATQPGGGRRASNLKRAHEFAGSIGRALDEQQLGMQQTRQRAEQARLQWLQRRVRLQAVEKATDRIVEREAVRAERNEQDKIDDLNNQRQRLRDR